MDAAQINIYDITPAEAARWLKKNKNNRPIRKERVHAYAADMKHGNWNLNTDPISFDSDGNLLNGQHRLSAVIEADATIQMLVAKNVDPQTVFDQGATRSIKDTLSYQGISTNNTEIAVVRFALRTACGLNTNTWAQVKAYYERRNTEIKEAVRISGLGAGGKYKVCRNATAQFAFMCALIYGMPAETIERFSKAVNSGFTDGKDQSAAIVVRNTLLENRELIKNRLRHFEEVIEKGLIDFSKGIPRTMAYKDGNNVIKDSFIANDGDFIKNLK